MASVQCFEKPKKGHRPPKYRGPWMDYEMSHAEWYGRREVHFPLPCGYMVEDYGYMARGRRHRKHHSSAQGRGFWVEGFGQQVQGLGHTVQAHGAYSSGLATVESQTACKGRNKGHYLSQYDQNDSMGQNNGRYLSQPHQNRSVRQSNGHCVAEMAQTQSTAAFQGNQREFTSCLAMANNKTEHRKNESESGSGSGSGSESESDTNRW
ncbi:hypothetical protein EUGRSUZ_L02362 [Eucalyptus grandis]|uniref:Uncharacterized protein n=1 Tax=Eucalyptus grandis TaxID=71139 RepID=A0A058ZQY8_EUCGR|nr:hypothetical protein EUGRSUZ_L02362 [Eucalyptus grandis]